MISIKIEDNSGQFNFSPSLRESSFISTFLPVKFHYTYASAPRDVDNVFDVSKQLTDIFVRDYEYQAIKTSGSGGGGYKYTFDNKISLLKYSDGQVIAEITMYRPFSLDQINQLSGFKIIEN